MRYIVLVGAFAVLHGCSTTPDDPTAMSVIEARLAVKEIIRKPDAKAFFMDKERNYPWARLTEIRVTKTHFLFISPTIPGPGKSYACGLDSEPEAVSLAGYRVIFSTSFFGACGHAVEVPTHEDALRLANALFVLKRMALGDAKVRFEDPAAEKAFDQVVQAYRSQPNAPLPAQARTLRMQAEAAIDAKRFDDAVHFYEQALKAAPWWADGYYNKALILSEMGLKDEAILNMRRYLRLAPNAPDARAAQNQIYKWEAEIRN